MNPRARARTDGRPSRSPTRSTRPAVSAAANYDNIAEWTGGQSLVGQAVETFGGLDVLINNAGILRDKMSFNMDEAEWDAVIEVHLKGHFATSRFAAAYWRQRSKETGAPVGGVIVNTSSESGLYGNAGQVNYAAAKAGIASMTIVMARELERIGVRVNAIAPVARTRLTEAVGGDFMAHQDGDFDRFAPENAAAMAVWLASADTDGITGQVFKVGGGQAQLLTGWRPVTEVTATDVWSLDSLTDRAGLAHRRARHRRPAVHATGAVVHLAWGPDDEAFRAELLAFLDEHAPPKTRTRRDFARVGEGEEIIPDWARDWQATLFDHGWMIPGYPPELGGRNATPVQTLVYLEELAAAGHPALAPLPRLRDRRAEPARVRHDRNSGRSRRPRSGATRSGASA